MQFGLTLRNARGNQIESTISGSPTLRMYTGGSPADCSQAATGTKLVDFALPSDWLTTFTAGSCNKNGTWSGSASGSGTLGYFRIYDAGLTTCQIQGGLAITGNPADMTLDNTNVASTQTVTVSQFTMTEGNA